MAAIVYLLCAFTALLCSVLLLRGYLQKGIRLLLWSGLCFILFALDNALLFVDRIVLPAFDMELLRTPMGLIGVCRLLYGLVWETK